MSYSQLSELDDILNEKQKDIVEKFFITIAHNNVLTAAKLAVSVSIDVSLAATILNKLANNGVLVSAFAIRCPNCGLLIQTVDSPIDIDPTMFCYNCEDDVQITTDDVEVLYKFSELPFGEGQQIDYKLGLTRSVVLPENALTHFVKNNIININEYLFDPSEEEYKTILEMYHETFSNDKSGNAKGDNLERLTATLFNLCKNFKATPDLRLRPNQIDCYVRNTLGIIRELDVDYFIIECKNECKRPGAEYVNKIYSILHLHGKKFGIIVSKSSAPKTFIQLSHKLFLKSNVIIISIDKDDLTDIVINKNNLLECITRKIDEVKLNATKDLRALGLYES